MERKEMFEVCDKCYEYHHIYYDCYGFHGLENEITKKEKKIIMPMYIKFAIMEHHKLITKIKDRIYKCNLCDKIFSRSALIIHMKSKAHKKKIPIDLPDREYFI